MEHRGATPPPLRRMAEAHRAIRESRRCGREDKSAILRFHKGVIAWLEDDLGWERAADDALILAFAPVFDADAEDDPAFERALAAFRTAAELWALGLRLTPPPGYEEPTP